MHDEAIRAALIARYQAGDYRSALKMVASLSESEQAALGAESKQVLAQCLAQIGDVPSACARFIEAAADHVTALSPNASICLTNASFMLAGLNHAAAAEWLGLFALQLPAPCDAQIALLRAMMSRYQHGVQSHASCDLLWSSLAAGGRYASTRSSAHATMLALAASDEMMTELAHDNEICGVAVNERAANGLISIVVCSHRDERFAAFELECRAAFSADAFELIRIADAKSMCEGYNRGLKRSRGDIVIFCHDDIEWVSAGVGSAIRRALATSDAVVSIGTSACHGPAWWAGPVDAYQGWTVFSPEPGRYGVGITGVPNPREGIVCGDGFFIACNRAVAEAVLWDETSLTGFHLYDVDFLARVAARFRVAVLRDVMICHQSGGAYDDGWRQAAERYIARRGGVMRAGPPDNLWTCSALYSRPEVAVIASKLARMLPTDWVGTLVARADAIRAAAVEQCPAIQPLQCIETHQAISA